MNPKFIIYSLFLLLPVQAFAQQVMELSNQKIHIEWIETSNGWEISKLAIYNGTQWQDLGHLSGEYTLLTSGQKPVADPQEEFLTGTGEPFPGESYKYIVPTWKKRTAPVNLNTAGEALNFYPGKAEKINASSVQFTAVTDFGTVTSLWTLGKESNDISIEQTFDADHDGYYSLASPTLVIVPENELKWATVPGYFHGNKLEENLPLSYGYGNGIPNRPIVFSEHTASTLSPMITSVKGFTIAAIPNPELGRDPWESDENTHAKWHLGISHMNRNSHLSPSIYYPVLGEQSSAMKAGETLTFGFRISIQQVDWFAMLNHAVYDVYEFEEGVHLRSNKQSLSNRVAQMHAYLMDPATSLWRIEDFEGKEIGAQSYLGGVVGSDKDAMKNADYGAMWMLAKSTGNPKINRQILPYALNFKLKQQQTADGFFKGAAIGQYYLYKSRKFVEEWGDMVEPIALMYYIMLDIGNILLFEPDNAELKERLRLGAELLLDWQKSDGSWAVAYGRDEEELFRELTDFRPTFYGLLVANRLLGDQKYLDAAVRGADWFIANGVENGKFLGVCGDARYVPDFATGQSAQAFLDLYELTKDTAYRDAAIRAAELYTTHIYTHPIANTTKKVVHGKEVLDWEIAQAGLSFEHGGALGSANGNGPILLASHAGMFIRMYELTGEPIFKDMARSAAIGRDAFVNKQTSVASYYWRAMDAGSGPFPHHAWWQIGWITDYLMAEVELRSNQTITFPRGFITPKVGPHQSYGFAPGSVFGDAANLKIITRGLTLSNPSIEHVVTASEDGKTLHVVLLNQRFEKQGGTVLLDLEKAGLPSTLKSIQVLDDSGKVIRTLDKEEDWTIEIEGYGLSALKIMFE
ncbi:glycoside hydrolase family protein [Algoriphagus resistens]|uniref:glycerophosphoryl diester phosphodiesterase n=1 Tax=Algoriphagus resistens TaxID=1750590 RepID=UPI0007169D83|nr:glycerophosphoryl diester phosphodiesterase [Algoriphagus resistens]